MNRQAVHAALEQALRYAHEQKVCCVAAPRATTAGLPTGIVLAPASADGARGQPNERGKDLVEPMAGVRRDLLERTVHRRTVGRMRRETFSRL
jgi:hypothetical protein